MNHIIYIYILFKWTNNVLNCTYMQTQRWQYSWLGFPLRYIRQKVKKSGASAWQRTVGFLLEVSLGLQRVLFEISVLYQGYQRGAAGGNINTISLSLVSIDMFSLAARAFSLLIFLCLLRTFWLIPTNPQLEDVPQHDLWLCFLSSCWQDGSSCRLGCYSVLALDLAMGQVLLPINFLPSPFFHTGSLFIFNSFRRTKNLNAVLAYRRKSCFRFS